MTLYRYNATKISEALFVVKLFGFLRMLSKANFQFGFPQPKDSEMFFPLKEGNKLEAENLPKTDLQALTVFVESGQYFVIEVAQSLRCRINFNSWKSVSCEFFRIFYRAKKNYMTVLLV